MVWRHASGSCCYAEVLCYGNSTMTASLFTPSRSPQDDLLARLFRVARNNRLSADAQHDYGFGLMVSGKPEESLEWLERAARLNPNSHAYQTNLAGALHRVGRWHEGLYHATRAFELDPTNVMAAINVAGFYYWFGEVEDAVVWYDKAVEIAPTHWQAWWMRLFMLDFLPISAERALAERRAFAAVCEAPLKAGWRPHPNNPDPEKRIRIGLTGGDFRQHSSSYMWGPIFEHLDRDRFQIYSYAHMGQVDAMTSWFQKGSNAWRDITRCSDDRLVAEQIRRDQIDVLIDLGTFSENAHLLAHLYKPAPVSMTAWGHLTGTGLDCMDGLLVDRVMVPEDRQWEMTERPAYVPYAMGWYRPHPSQMVELTPRPERPLTFGYLGRVQKLDDPTVALWADLLHANPGSRLLLKDVAYHQERSVLRTAERFEAWGIDPRRIEFRGPTGRTAHLEAWRDLDVALDPLPQGGGATTLEGLMQGVPTVTLRGERLVRRVGASTVTVAGHPDWVAENVHEYVEIAGRIASLRGPEISEPFLNSHICDGAARTRAFEAAIRALWIDWCERQTAT